MIEYIIKDYIIDYAYRNVQEYMLPMGLKSFDSLFRDLYEN